MWRKTAVKLIHTKILRTANNIFHFSIIELHAINMYNRFRYNVDFTRVYYNYTNIWENLKDWRRSYYWRRVLINFQRFFFFFFDRLSIILYRFIGTNLVGIKTLRLISCIPLLILRFLYFI